ncbi:MAG: ABC transporter ATP-binding protein/permease [Oscillospiraceae bacterium]|nr:ABC transporter ATP-binding protein/permease [Oscillospiraceae bacterium]
MANTIRIDRSGLEKAEAFLDKNVRLDGREKTTCLMICEELILRLLQSGNDALSVSVKGAFTPHVEITADLPVDDLHDLRGKSEEERIEAEIRKDLLSRYGAYIDQEQKNGQTVYRVYSHRRGGEVFSEEIFRFYQGDRRRGLDGPTGLLRYLAGNHAAMVGFSVFNRTLKHTCALMLPVFAAGMIDTLSTCSSFFEAPVLLNILGAMLALLVNLICATVDARVYQRFVRGVESGFRMAIVQKIQVLSMKYYSSTPSGKILSKLVSDVQFIKLLLCEQMQTVLHLGIDIVFVIVMSLLRLPLMLVFYAVVIPMSAWIIRRYMPPIRASKANMRRRTEVVNASFKEMLAMEDLSRAHGAEEAQIQRISPRVCSVESAAIEQDRLQVHLNNAGYATAQGFRLLCVSIAIYLAFQGRITVASVVLFASLFDALNNSVQKFLDDIPQITQELDSLTSVDELLSERDTEKNGTALLPLPFRGEICFEDVTFSYSQEQPPVLQKVSMQIPAGSCVAFVGKSGAGKSTILSLLLGLYSPQSGRITVDGMDLDEIDKTRYRRYIAVVPQNSVLFSGTLWDTLTYGLKYVSEERVTQVLKSVGLLELVTAHPDGLFRPIYENGENLSGGQRQRISIARALLREPGIILFDEATSALDSECEQEVQAAIEAIIGQCTVVMVAHRLNTIRKAGIIYRIEDGCITRCDPDAELRG